MSLDIYLDGEGMENTKIGRLQQRLLHNRGGVLLIINRSEFDDHIGIFHGELIYIDEKVIIVKANE